MADLASPFPAAVRTVGVFFPSGIPEAARLERGLARLRGWGLEVVQAGLPQPERFLAAPDAVRAEAINALVRDPRVDLLLAARGGYGCGRILDRVDFAALRERGLPLVGYSDITALHLAAYGAGCRTCVAGPMVCSALAKQPADEAEERSLGQVVDSFRRVLAGEGTEVSGGLQVLREGLATGPLVPANLSLVASLVGTPYLPDLSGAILAIEDVGEAAYRVDRYLNQLLHAGILARLAGLVYGQFTEGDDAQWLPGVFADFAQHVPGPVVAGLEFGHGFPSISLPVGRPARLKASAGGARLGVGPRECRETSFGEMLQAAARDDLEFVRGHFVPSFLAARSERGETLLHLAGDKVTRFLLARGADISARTDEGYLPIHCATEPATIRLLIAAGSDANARSEFGFTPLHLVSTVSQAETLIAAGAQVNAMSHDGDTPLDLMVDAGLYEVARLLVSHGAQTFNELHAGGRR